MRDNGIQFAVVREDPAIERALIEAHGNVRSAVVVASGGCTALALGAWYPELRVTAVDPNPAQLDLLRRKRLALGIADEAARARAFNVGDDDPAGLSQCGNFESLFRGLRGLIADLCASPQVLRAAFADRPERNAAVEQIVTSRYWPVAFELFFSEPILHAMFGPAATQHAERGSYPGYFRQRLEAGLRANDAPLNHFLHHILLGMYLPDALPPFLGMEKGSDPFSMQGSIAEAGDAIAEADLVQLSNIFDWMSHEEAADTLRVVAARIRPGAVLVIRQLNNRRPIERLLERELTIDDERAAALLPRERSLFYERLVIAWKR